MKKLIKKITNNKLETLLLFGVIILYLTTHLSSLTELPVFADESIYIRWSQLIIDDWRRFLFFSMNDGKTPLFIWIMTPFQLLFKDQLFAGRFVSVLVGLFQLLINVWIIKILGGRKKTQIIAGLFTVILPFWYFHHRIALMDAMLTMFISLSFAVLAIVAKNQNKVGKKFSIKKIIDDRKSLRLLFLAGIFFGLSILTKIPAVLFIPALYLSIFVNRESNPNTLFASAIKVSISVLVGLVIFGLLKFNPVFGQLFSRGGDFLFPLSEIFSGKWVDTTASIPNYILYFLIYMTPGLLIFSIIGLFSKKHKRSVHVLFWSGIFFILPIAVMGKIVYPRYLFPAALFFTLSSVMGLESVIMGSFRKNTKIWKKMLVGVIVALLISNTITSSMNFINYSISNADRTPFVSSDVVQYLYEWSSGHGIKETVELIEQATEEQTIAVATEGYFGTLPDGLLMYLHGRNVDNLYLEGIGYPLVEIPESFAVRARDFDRIWLVVNSHRMNLNVDREFLIDEYCRPYNGPCLQVWDITENFELYVK